MKKATKRFRLNSEAIEAWRKTNKIGFIYFAENNLGMTKTYYSLLVKGKRRPTVNVIELLHFATGMPVNELLIPA